jgi:hypothetical protein
VLLEIGKESPAFKDQMLALAQMWLTLAVLEDQIIIWADQAERESSAN